MKTNKHMRDIPVVIITAHGDNELSILNMGAVDFITKPFDIAQVRKRVEFAINQAQKKK